MKIMQINSFFSVGGPPRIMNGIYSTLLENGHECKIAAARESIMFNNDSIRIGNKCEIYSNALKARIFDNEGLSAKRATKRLIRDIESFNPDIIHIHNLHGYYINIEILFQYLKRSEKPVVWTMHDCWPITGHCAYFDYVGCNQWKAGCKECSQQREYPASFIMDCSKRNWAKKKSLFMGLKKMIIVTPSRWLGDIMKESFLNSYPIKVINNGIDLNTFSVNKMKVKDKYGLQMKKIVLGVAQNWEEHKGFEDFIELSKLLDQSYQVVMVGLTDEQMGKIPKTVMGIKRTESIEELVAWYSNAQVFVNMTYQDNFPTVNLEALACGTPVITYDTGGSPEAIDCTSGWTIERGNVAQVVEIIKSMKDREAYSESARTRSRLFDRKKTYLDYINCYKRLLLEQ